MCHNRPVDNNSDSFFLKKTIQQSPEPVIFAGLFFASLAQLVEQLIRNEQVVGSSPMRGSRKKKNAILTGMAFLLLQNYGSGYSFNKRIFLAKLPLAKKELQRE